MAISYGNSSNIKITEKNLQYQELIHTSFRFCRSCVYESAICLEYHQKSLNYAAKKNYNLVLSFMDKIGDNADGLVK